MAQRLDLARDAFPDKFYDLFLSRAWPLTKRNRNTFSQSALFGFIEVTLPLAWGRLATENTEASTAFAPPLAS
jgi:hypothetical protein